MKFENSVNVHFQTVYWWALWDAFVIRTLMYHVKMDWRLTSCSAQNQTVFHSSVQFNSVAQSCPILCDPMNRSTPGLPVHHQLLEFTQTHVHQVGDAIPGVHSNSCPLSQQCHPAISSSVVPFSSWPQYLLASESFPMSQLFTWGGQSTGVSASASVLPMNTQDWSPLGWTGWISLQSNGLSGVFSSTAVQKHQFFGAQSLWSNSHIGTWLLEKP